MCVLSKCGIPDFKFLVSHWIVLNFKLIKKHSRDLNFVDFREIEYQVYLLNSIGRNLDYTRKMYTRRKKNTCGIA